MYHAWHVYLQCLYMGLPADLTSLSMQDMPVGQQTALAPGGERARQEAEHMADLHRMISSLSSRRRDGLK